MWIWTGGGGAVVVVRGDRPFLFLLWEESWCSGMSGVDLLLRGGGVSLSLSRCCVLRLRVCDRRGAGGDDWFFDDCALAAEGGAFDFYAFVSVGDC